jgi:Oxidoreductase molybdopterin binding domain
VLGRRLLATLTIAVPALLCGLPAFAGDVQILAPNGRTATLDPAVLAHMQSVTAHVSFLTEHGAEAADYTGATLWSVLQQLGLVTSTNPRDREKQAIVVTGHDGYAVVLAMAEIDPAFESKQILLVDEVNGHPMPADEIRLVVPGDRRGGRSVRDVARIDIRNVAP